MKRREFIAGLSLAAAWPLAARAQVGSMPTVGYLSAGSLGDRLDTTAYFHRGLSETGYVEGRNVSIEYRWTEGNNARLPALVADLVRRQVAVIAIPNTTASALAAKKVTQTIPIVFFMGSDPVEIGLVARFNHPGGNVTGFASLSIEVAGKRLELLHELVPAVTAIAFLANPSNPVVAEVETRSLQSAARVLGLHLLIMNASSPSEIEAAFAALVQQQAGALVVSTDTFFVSRAAQVVALTERHAVPAIYPWREATAAAAGGLMSFGTDLQDAVRQVGIYTGRILKGDKPGDLPVQQVTKLELVINLKTAKALGLTIPETLLATADEVIQ
jgi:putative tryptophan/tyrosine transport system substrate-binding protein